MLEKVRFGIIYFLLFCLPLVVIPTINFGFETPKVVIAEILIEILLIATIFEKRYQILKKFNKVYLLAITLLFLSSLYSLVMQGIGQNFTGNIFRLQGVFLFWNLGIFSLLVANFSVQAVGRKWLMIIFLSLFASVFVIGTNLNGRYVGTLGEPNSLAAVALFLFCFLYGAWKKWVTKLPFLLILISILVFSGSRSGLVAFLIMVIIFVIHKVIKNSYALFFIGLILFILSLGLPFVESNLSYKNGSFLIRDAGNDTSYRFEDRSTVWRIALNAGLESPVIGNGWGNIQKPLLTEAKKQQSILQYVAIDSSHNIFLDLWVQSGALGVITFSLIFCLSFFRLLRKHTKEYAMALYIIIIMASFNPMSVCLLLPLWWLLGFANYNHD